MQVERIVRANRLMRTSRIVILVGFCSRGGRGARGVAWPDPLAKRGYVGAAHAGCAANRSSVADRNARTPRVQFAAFCSARTVRNWIRSSPRWLRPESELDALRTLTSDNSVQLDRVQELARLTRLQERAVEHMRHAGKTRPARCRARRHQFSAGSRNCSTRSEPTSNRSWTPSRFFSRTAGSGR